ncbi:hypothetical protein [Natrinema sp. J7-1]|uniref:hypothetical protein n=1 Tax=Natrinema sp. J7-1 TaxID=1172566 RepID=UPI0006775E49|nr:hypothetical protein [Natrinema sp. J7-1]
MITGHKPTGCNRCDAPRPLDARGLCDRCADIVDHRELQARVDEARERQTQRDLERQREFAHEAEAGLGGDE